VECTSEQWIPAVFGAWKQAGIRFVVLRNYEDLPGVLGNDLDVLVEPSRVREAESLLVKAIHACGGRMHNRASFSPVSLFFHHPGSGRQYHVDLFHNLLWRGCVLLDANNVLTGARLHGDIPVPAVADEATLNLLTRLLYGGYVRDKYKNAIISILAEHPQAVQERITQALGHVGHMLLQEVAKSRWQVVESQVLSLRRALLRQNIYHPVRLLRNWAQDALRLFKRALHPPGLALVLVGPDGCGKTSVGVSLKQRLAGTFYPEYTTHLHWKPRLTNAKASRATPFGVPCTEPHGQSIRPLVLNALYFLAHTLEIPLAWWWRVRPHLFRNHLVMIDRYYYDFMVDSRRYRLAVSPRWAWLMYRFIPKPDLVFCLSAPAAVIHARKQEVLLSETDRQTKAYEQVVSKLPYGHLIDANRPLQEVVAEIEQIVLMYLEQRYQSSARPGSSL
jgi:thymidylate kinase